MSKNDQGKTNILERSDTMQKIDIHVCGVHVDTIEVEYYWNDSQVEEKVAERVADNTEWNYS